MFKLFRKRNKNQLISESSELLPNSEWCKIVNKASSDYDSLTKNERIWFNIRILIDSINDGGLISYYYNSGANYVYETIEDLKTLEMIDIVNIIEKHNEILFGKETVPNDLTIRNKYIEKITDSSNDKLNNLELDIMNRIDSIEERLDEFIKNNRLTQ